MIEVNITLIKLSEEHKDDLMIMCKVDELDFSDKAIIKICEDNQFILLTNDTDFKNSYIDIVSCHKRMFL